MHPPGPEFYRPGVASWRAFLSGGRTSFRSSSSRNGAQITRYGKAGGLAFQIADDILDIEGEETMRGKKRGGDKTRGKATYPGLVGLDEAKGEAQRLVQEALDAIASFNHRADPLREIARFIVLRKA